MPENLNLYQMGNIVSHRHQNDTYSRQQQRTAPYASTNTKYVNIKSEQCIRYNLLQLYD